MNITLLLCLSWLTVLHAAQVAGYGRDGSRIYPDCTPPTSWTEEDIRWEAMLPGYNCGSPSFVNGKVYTMCEPAPGFDFPLLVCLDATTGKELWRREVDHLAATGFSSAEQQEIRTAWHTFLSEFYERTYMRMDYQAGDPKTKEIMKEKGYAWGGGKSLSGRQGRIVYADKERGRGLAKTYRKAGLTGNVSQHSFACGIGVGTGFATPCSDGESVYAATSFGAVAAYTLEGKPRWIGWAKGVVSNEGCLHGRSPILWDPPKGLGPKLIISDMAHLVRAFDRSSGKLLWTGQISNSHTIVSPGILTVPIADEAGQTVQVLWTAGAQAWRLPDGKELKVDGWKDEGMQFLVKYDEPDVAYFSGGGEHGGWNGKGRISSSARGNKIGPPACVRFSLSGDVLKAKILWHAGTTKDLADPPFKGQLFGQGPTMVYHQNKLYHSAGWILNALTGKLIRGRANKTDTRSAASPLTRHLMCIANGHVYGVGGKHYKDPLRSSRAEVYTLDGEFVSRNVVLRSAGKEHTKAWLRTCTGKEDWGFSYGCGFTFGGDALFVRTLTSVICIGK